MTTSAEVLERLWQPGTDYRSTLSVYADALIEEGDVRGEFIQLSLLEAPTEAQSLKRTALLNKHGGKLVGPARPYVREWTFGADGLVDWVRCEADKLLEGFDAIARMNPRATVAVTSLRTLKLAKELAKLELGRIAYIDFTAGSQMSDKVLTALAPGFATLRYVALMTRGEDAFSDKGLRAMSEHTRVIEYLGVDVWRRTPNTKPFEDVIANAPGFRTLKAFWVGDRYRDDGGPPSKLDGVEEAIRGGHSSA